MIKIRQLPVLILISILALMYSCKRQVAPVEAMFKEDCDTSNLVKLANFLSDEERYRIAMSDNGYKTLKGIKSVPQSGDDFRYDTLDYYYWHKVVCRYSDFRGASFRSSDCSEGDFTGCDFRVSDIRWTSFFFSKMDSCDFSQSKMFHVYGTGATFNDSKFAGANMFGMEAHNAMLKRCDFSNALMKDTEFIDAEFTGSKAIHVRFIRAVMQNARLDSMDLCFSDFTGSGLKGTKFCYSRLHHVNFQGSHLQGADFTGADLKGTNFFGAELENTVFKDAINIPEEIKRFIKDGVATGILQDRGKK